MGRLLVDGQPPFVMHCVGDFRDYEGKGIPKFVYVWDDGGIDTPSAHTRTFAFLVDAHYSNSVASTFRSPSQGPLVCPWGVVPVFFDDETT